MVMSAVASMEGRHWLGIGCLCSPKQPRIPSSCSFKLGLPMGHGLLWNSFPLKSSPSSDPSSRGPFFLWKGLAHMPKEMGIQIVSPNTSSPGRTVEFLDAWDDEYEGIVVNPQSLPSSSNAFAPALGASMSSWKSKGKKGIWLKILEGQADLVPIAIQEGFEYHHAEPGYVMLTHWIPREPCMLPASPSHLIGVAGFVINDGGEVLVVKEKCACNCNGVWKLPTGYINKSEDIFSGAVREVKEETGIDTVFLEMVAFRHAHLVAFEKSDLLFVCMLKPLSFEITIDDKEIQAAKWIAVDEILGQPFYNEDHMSKRVIDICVAAYEERYRGFIAHQLPSKIDGKLSILYCDDFDKISKRFK
ncbi:nudix hydrolase 8-like [Malania oleifera]|uniref:nudix hydrolase 8-like n=1 Tax=Malania oleifera TaxID=397392 RepID=UPI0025AE250A|nr:nudix hydrolase 8-like [Malania oleifera]